MVRKLQQLSDKRDKLVIKLSDLGDKLAIAGKKENELIARRGWGYGMRHTKIGFSTRVTDNLKERINKCQTELDQVNEKIHEFNKE